MLNSAPSGIQGEVSVPRTDRKKRKTILIWVRFIPEDVWESFQKKSLIVTTWHSLCQLWKMDANKKKLIFLEGDTKRVCRAICSSSKKKTNLY